MCVSGRAAAVRSKVHLRDRNIHINAKGSRGGKVVQRYLVYVIILIVLEMLKFP